MFIDKLLFQRHLEKGEEIKFSVHKHWSGFVGTFIRVAFFGFLVPIAFYTMGFNSRLFLLLIVIWMVIAFFRLIYDWVDWYSDVWLFTNMSVIVVEWNGFFSNLSTRIDYEDTEGMAFEITGFWATIFRYGNIVLKVISGNNIEKKRVKNPKKVELALMKYQGEYVRSREMMDAGHIKKILSDMVAHHIRHK